MLLQPPQPQPHPHPRTRNIYEKHQQLFLIFTFWFHICLGASHLLYFFLQWLNTNCSLFLPGEAAPETLAEGSDMVIQELSKSCCQSHVRCRIKQGSNRQRDGTLVKAQTSHLPGQVG